MSPAFTAHARRATWLMGAVCVNVNECSPNPCGPGTAPRTPGHHPGYTGTCPSGYIPMGGAFLHQLVHAEPCGVGTCNQNVLARVQLHCPTGSTRPAARVWTSTNARQAPADVAPACRRCRGSAALAQRLVLESTACVNDNECDPNPCMPGAPARRVTPGWLRCSRALAARPSEAQGNIFRPSLRPRPHVGNRVLATQLTRGVRLEPDRVRAVPAMARPARCSAWPCIVTSQARQECCVGARPFVRQRAHRPEGNPRPSARSPPTPPTGSSRSRRAYSLGRACRCRDAVYDDEPSRTLCRTLSPAPWRSRPRREPYIVTNDSARPPLASGRAPGAPTRGCGHGRGSLRPERNRRARAAT